MVLNHAQHSWNQQQPAGFQTDSKSEPNGCHNRSRFASKQIDAINQAKLQDLVVEHTLLKLSDTLVGQKLEHDELCDLWAVLEVLESYHSSIIISLRVDENEETFGNELSVYRGRKEQIERSVEDKVPSWVIAVTLECIYLSVVTLAHPELTGLLYICCEVDTPLLVDGEETWRVENDVENVRAEHQLFSLDGLAIIFQIKVEPIYQNAMRYCLQEIGRKASVELNHLVGAATRQVLIHFRAYIKVHIIRVLSRQCHDSSALGHIMCVLWIVSPAFFFVFEVVGQDMNEWTDELLIDVRPPCLVDLLDERVELVLQTECLFQVLGQPRLELIIEQGWIDLFHAEISVFTVCVDVWGELVLVAQSDDDDLIVLLLGYVELRRTYIESHAL